MRTTKMLESGLCTLAVTAMLAAPAYAAVDTSVTYKSGILVLVFLGVLALIVVAQLVPALILMIGFFKAVVTAVARKKVAVEQNTTK